MNKLHLNLPAVDPSKCVIRLADMINANERAKRLAAIMMTEIVNEEISAGKSPMAVAASILYICCKRTGYHTSHLIDHQVLNSGPRLKGSLDQ